MTLEEIKEGLQTAGEQELLTVDEIIGIIINEMQTCKKEAHKIILMKYSIKHKIIEIQAKEAQIFALADFLERLGVNEMYLAILKDEMSLGNVERLLYRVQEAQKGCGINAYSN